MSSILRDQPLDNQPQEFGGLLTRAEVDRREMHKKNREERGLSVERSEATGADGEQRAEEYFVAVVRACVPAPQLKWVVPASSGQH